MEKQTQQERRNDPERRSRSHKEINDLVESRTGALTLYGELAAKRPFTQEQGTQTLLQNFCESLIDYTASAHFQLYRHIDEERERRKPVLDVADQLYPSISDITQKILDFNDKYDCEDHCSDFSHLADDLSELGESLADRIELEDQLIDMMMANRRVDN